MKERLRRAVRNLTPEEHKRRREGIGVYPYQLVPTGELSLNLDSWPSRAIVDRKKARLEDLLNEFIQLLVERAYADKAGREKCAEDERRQQEARTGAGDGAAHADRGGATGPFRRAGAALERNEKRRAF